MLARLPRASMGQVVLLTPSKSSAPTQLLSCQHFIPVSPLAATLMGLPASVANKRLTAELNLLDATLTENRGVGGPSGTPSSASVKIAVLSFHALTNCPLFPQAKQSLYFHGLTNCPFSIPFVLTFMHRMGGVGGVRPPRHSITVPKPLTYYVCRDPSSRRVLLQERPKSLRPTFQIFHASERNNHRKNFFRGRRHHGALGIARRTAVRPDRIGEKRQSFQIQIVFADALVRFPGCSRAKHNFSDHMPQVVQSNRQSAFHRNKIDHVHYRINFRQTLTADHAPQQRFRRTAVARRIFSQRFIGRARRFLLRRRQHAARKRQLLNFRLPRFQLRHQRGRRRARLHVRGNAAKRRPRAFLLQCAIDFHNHFAGTPMFQILQLPGAFYSRRCEAAIERLRLDASLVLNFMDSRPVAQLVRALP